MYTKHTHAQTRWYEERTRERKKERKRCRDVEKMKISGKSAWVRRAADILYLLSWNLYYNNIIRITNDTPKSWMAMRRRLRQSACMPVKWKWKLRARALDFAVGIDRIYVDNKWILSLISLFITIFSAIALEHEISTLVSNYPHFLHTSYKSFSDVSSIQIHSHRSSSHFFWECFLFVVGVRVFTI